MYFEKERSASTLDVTGNCRIVTSAYSVDSLGNKSDVHFQNVIISVSVMLATDTGGLGEVSEFLVTSAGFRSNHINVYTVFQKTLTRL